MADTGKELNEVQRYFVAFWTNYRRIAEWKKILEKVERGEKKILRLRHIRDAIMEKVERHIEETFGSRLEELVKVGEDGQKKVPSTRELLNHSWPRMKINYGSGFSRNRSYQEEEDAFLVCMMYRHGYGAAERIRMEIRRAWQFRFDWYFKSRSAQEIQKRCDLLVKVIERENEEVQKKEEEEKQKMAAQRSETAPTTGETTEAMQTQGADQSQQLKADHTPAPAAQPQQTPQQE